MYEESVNDFLDYFRDSGRLVTVDVSCGVPDLIWGRVSQFFREMEFSAYRTLNTVVVYLFGEYRYAQFPTGSHGKKPSLLENISIQRF